MPPPEVNRLATGFVESGDAQEENQEKRAAGFREQDENATALTISSSFLAPLNSLVVGLPVKLISSALVESGIIEQDSVEKFESDYFMTLGRTEPNNRAERTAYKAGEYFRDNLAALLPQSYAAKLATVSIEGAELAGQYALPRIINPKTIELVRQELTLFMQNNPLGAAIGEQLSASFAGAFGNEAKEEGAGPGGQFVAELAGGLAPGALAKTPSAFAARALYRLFKPGAFEERARSSIGKKIGRSLDEDAEANIAEANKVFADLGTNAKPTIAEASNEPSLLAAQRRIEQEASGSTLNALTRRKTQIVEEVMDPNRFSPEYSGAEPTVIYDAATGEIVAARSAVESDLMQNQAEIEALEARLPGLNSNEKMSAGQTLRDIRKTLKQEVTEVFAVKADDIGLNDLGAMFPMGDLQAGMYEEFFVSGSRYANIVGKKSKVLKRIKNEYLETLDLKSKISTGKASEADLLRLRELQSLTFEDVIAIRASINDEISKTMSVGGGNSTLRHLTAVKKHFDNWFSNVQPNNVDPQAWSQFRAEYKSEVIDRFDSGTALKISRRGKNEYRVKDEEVASLFFETPSGAVDYKALYGDNPAAMVAMRSAILDEARSRSVRDGVLNRNSLVNWIERTPSLDQFPQVKEELLGVASSAKALSAREAQLRQRSLVIGKTELSAIAGRPAEQMVSGALKDIGEARELGRLARATDQMGVLNALVFKEAAESIGTVEGHLPNPARLLTWIDDNEKSMLAMGLGRKYINDLRNVYSALVIVNRTPLPTGRAEALGPMEAIEGVLGSGVPQLSSRFFAAESGRTSYRYIAIDGLARFFNRVSKNQQDALLKEALFDESLARDLSSASKMKNLDVVTERRLRSWLFVVGMPAGGSEFEENSRYE